MSISDHFKYMFFSCKHPAAIISDPATIYYCPSYILQQLSGATTMKICTVKADAFDRNRSETPLLV